MFIFACMKEYLKYLFSLKKLKITTGSSLSNLAWKRFIKNKLSLGALIFIALCVIVSLAGYLITPDQTPFANEQFLELSTLKPGTSVNMLLIKRNKKFEPQGIIKKMLFGKKSRYRKIPFSSYHFEDDKIIIKEYADPSITDHQTFIYNMADVCYSLKADYEKIKFLNDTLFFENTYGKYHSKSIKDLQKEIIDDHIKTKTFILGSDRFGRDMLSRLLIGTRVSLSVGFISVFISLIIGITLGSIAGFFRGKIDNFIIWLINVVWSIPTLLLVIAITFALGKGFWQVFIAVGLTMWVEVARVIRGQIISIREKEFIEAGRALGFSNFRLIIRHILPNVMGPVIVISAANFAAAILIEAGLSFLGIGVQPPMPSWGSMIKEHYGYLILDSAFLAILPGIAIILMVLAFMLIGNALRDALDVKVVSA